MNDLEMRKLKADEEDQEVLKWASLEEGKVNERLKSAGRLKVGLDVNSAEYTYIYDEVRRRTKEIVYKYDLPNKDKWS